ncbi:hypothetical protein Bca4012_024588 [Brassica carinata]
MSGSQCSGGYNYIFGEADEVTRRIEENRRQHGRNNDIPPLVSPEHLSDNISPTMNYRQPQSQHTMSINPNPSDHHQFQNQPTIRRPFCLRCLVSMLISWLMSFFVPTNRPRPIRRPLPTDTPHPPTSGLSSSTERLRDRPSQHSLDEGFVVSTSEEILQRRVVPEIFVMSTSQEILQRNVVPEMFVISTSEEILQRSVVPERVFNVGIGLTERQISQLPTIKFQPSIEDKKYSYSLLFFYCP